MINRRDLLKLASLAGVALSLPKTEAVAERPSSEIKVSEVSSQPAANYGTVIEIGGVEYNPISIGLKEHLEHTIFNPTSFGSGRSLRRVSIIPPRMSIDVELFLPLKMAKITPGHITPVKVWIKEDAFSPKIIILDKHMAIQRMNYHSGYKISLSLEEAYL